MPSKTDKQARLMRAVAHGWTKPGGGPSKKVAQEFVAADKNKKKKYTPQKAKVTYAAQPKATGDTKP